MPGDAQPDFVIRLRPLKDDYGVLPAIRLRRGLKHLLRAIDHREVPRDSPIRGAASPNEEPTS
jgi:hypothetical protein